MKESLGINHRTVIENIAWRKQTRGQRGDALYTGSAHVPKEYLMQWVFPTARYEKLLDGKVSPKSRKKIIETLVSASSASRQDVQAVAHALRDLNLLEELREELKK